MRRTSGTTTTAWMDTSVNNEPFNHYKFGLTDHQMTQLKPIFDEMDRNARAYGWEIGQGQVMAQVINFSPDNPFLDPDWRDHVHLHTNVREAPQDAEASSTGGDQQPEQREDTPRGRWGREITYGSGVLPDEGGTG